MSNEKEKSIFDEFGGYPSPVNIIAGAAFTEHVQEMNGNAKRTIGKSLRTYRDGKVYLGDEEIEVSAGACVSPYVYKYALRLDEKPVDWSQIKNLDPNLRMTKGMYMIKYVPKASKDHRKCRPYKIGQDLIRWDIRVSGPVEWHELCSRVPELKWLERNSTLSDELFELAVQHPGMAFWFTVDWVNYAAKIRDQSETFIKKPFVSRKCSVKEYKDIHKITDKTILIRAFGEILKEVNEVEALDTVQKEMLDVSGEVYDRSRKCLRDPKTGRFIYKKEEE